MKHHISENIVIPEGISCSYQSGQMICKKGSTELMRKFNIPNVNVSVDDKKITFECVKGNKGTRKKILSFIAHLNNFFMGLDEKFAYELEVCNVHFPMTLKLEKDHLLINNFLGEKTPRKARVLANVHVDIKGQKIHISSADIEAAGQTAANIEKSTKVRNRDRRIFQDGIFIVSKPGGKS